MRESPIFSRTYDLLRWLLPATVKFPRQQRFVLAAAMQRTAFALQEALIEAALGTVERDGALGRADVALSSLRLYLRLSRDLALLKDGQHEHAASMVDEIGRLLGGWKKSAARNRRAYDAPRGPDDDPRPPGWEPPGASPAERSLRGAQQEHP